MRAVSNALAVTVLASVGAIASGCFGGTCFFRVCDEAGNCRCSVSNCGDGAGFDTRINRCRCLRGFALVAGQCLSPDEANTYCGRGQHWEASLASTQPTPQGVPGRPSYGGCAADRCNPGDELDQSSGQCIPHEQVNQVASNIGVTVAQGQKLGCPEGQKLIVDGANAVCVPLEQTCAHDEHWDGKACVKTEQCAAGSSWDTTQSKCVEYAKTSPAEETKVDVGQWSTSNYGANNGAGTAAFCSAFAKKPYVFAISQGSNATLRITVTMAFPENEVAKGTVQTQTVYDRGNAPVPPKGAAEVDASARAIFSTLAKGGGRADAPSSTTVVKCQVVSASKPQSVPATGGL